MNSNWRTLAVMSAVLQALAVVGAQQQRARDPRLEPYNGLTQTPAVRQIPRSPAVDAAAHDRGRALWASHCIDCHGSQARGSEKGPNIIRTKTVNFDRSSFSPGSVLGPFLKTGHPTQSGKASASFTDEEIVGLAHFLRQRVNDTMRSSPLFTAADILVGDPKAGEAYFNGAGGCAACHNATTRSLNGIRARVATTVDLQQRMLFPGNGMRGRGAGDPNAVTVTVTPLSGPAMSGVLVERSDFYVTFRQPDGTIRVVPTTGAKVVTTNPLQAHIDLLDRISDKQIHDVVAYLENLK
jgi:mono/diheme cytochrome c family protein